MNRQQIVPCMHPKCPSGSATHYVGSLAYMECISVQIKNALDGEPSRNISAVPPTSQMPLDRVPTENETTNISWTELRPGDKLDMSPVAEQYDEDYDPHTCPWEFEVAEVLSVRAENSDKAILHIQSSDHDEEFAVPMSATIPRYDFLEKVPREDDREFLAKSLDSFYRGSTGVSPDWYNLSEGQKNELLEEADDILRRIGNRRNFTDEDDVNELAEDLLESKVDAGEIDDPVSQSDRGRMEDYARAALGAIGNIFHRGETPAHQIQDLAQELSGYDLEDDAEEETIDKPLPHLHEEDDHDNARGHRGSSGGEHRSGGRPYYGRRDPQEDDGPKDEGVNLEALLGIVDHPEEDSEYKEHLINITSEILNMREARGEAIDLESLSQGEMEEIQGYVEIAMKYFGIEKEGEDR